MIWPNARPFPLRFPARLPEQTDAQTHDRDGGWHTLPIDLLSDLILALAEGRRIVPVLDNLVSNASSYSSGTRPVRVSAVRDELHVATPASDARKTPEYAGILPAKEFRDAAILSRPGSA